MLTPSANPAEPRPRCGFLHIPKTAGKSIRTALISTYEEADTSPYQFDDVLFGNFDRYDTFAEPIRRRTLTRHDDPVMLNARLVAGHLAYQTITRFMDPGDVFTVVREPRARLLSHQLYWSARLPAMTAAYGDYQVERTAVDGLKRFLEQPAGAHQHDNLHVRLLCGADLPADRPLLEAELADATERSLANLRTLGAVLFVESSTFWNDFTAFIGIDTPELRENDMGATPVPVPFHGSQLDDETLEMLDARTAGDRQVYLAVLRARLGVDDAVAVRLADRAFAKQVERYARQVARDEASR